MTTDASTKTERVVPLHSYAKGSWGPKEADALLPDGVPWHDPV